MDRSIRDRRAGTPETRFARRRSKTLGEIPIELEMAAAPPCAEPPGYCGNAYPMALSISMVRRTAGRVIMRS